MEGDAVARIVGTRRREEASGTFLPFVNGRDARGATGRPSRREIPPRASSREPRRLGCVRVRVVCGSLGAVRARYAFFAKNL
jgi:hypothetical protein